MEGRADFSGRIHHHPIDFRLPDIFGALGCKGGSTGEHEALGLGRWKRSNKLVPGDLKPYACFMSFLPQNTSVSGLGGGWCWVGVGGGGRR